MYVNGVCTAKYMNTVKTNSFKGAEWVLQMLQHYKTLSSCKKYCLYYDRKMAAIYRRGRDKWFSINGSVNGYSLHFTQTFNC